MALLLFPAIAQAATQPAYSEPQLHGSWAFEHKNSCFIVLFSANNRYRMAALVPVPVEGAAARYERQESAGQWALFSAESLLSLNTQRINNFPVDEADNAYRDLLKIETLGENTMSLTNTLTKTNTRWQRVAHTTLLPEQPPCGFASPAQSLKVEQKSEVKPEAKP